MKTSIKVIEALLNTSRGMTIKEVSNNIKSDYRITHTAIQRLHKKNIVTLVPIGTARVCSMDTRYYGHEIYEAEHNRKQKLLSSPNIRQVYRDLMTGLPTVHCTLLYVPPYQAHGNSTIVGITDNQSTMAHLKKVVSLVPLPLAVHCMTETEFLFQRHQPDSMAHQVIKRNIILHGVESYYNLKGK